MDQFVQLKVRGCQNKFKKNMIQVFNTILNRHSLDSKTHLKTTINNTKLQQRRYEINTQKITNFINTSNNQIKDITEGPACKNISTGESLT